ncbi:hypothetical protein H359_0031 [Chlamydia ibidis 10-1398/6]|uniref:Uncharacterized protein n=1 Tax=Chlamydia ibidis 10-1398/6 TaxID=1046581 RepID=A0ABP2XEZ2_9CHLA|nr:hypothetical protein H359_0031 [Chlamydia ibidis 10-1398/6]
MTQFDSTSPPSSTEDDLIQLNRAGIIAGPEELKLSFFLRVEEILNNAPEYPEIFPQRLRDLFDIYPDHLTVLYSNEGMDVWEGGCTWILNNHVTVQLRKQLHKAARWLGIYSKEEILAHEAVHAARMKFYEPMFEELLAYQTSSSVIRRFLGPLFRSPGENYSFLLFTITGIGLSLWEPIVGIATILSTPIYFGARLLITQYFFHLAKKKYVRC